MRKPTKLKNLVKRQREMTEAIEQMRVDMLEQALTLLKEYNIRQIGLWSVFFTESFGYERETDYNKEDDKLYNSLELDLEPLNGNVDYFCSGKVIAVRLEDEALQFVCADDTHREICILDAMECAEFPEEMGVDLTGVMDTLAKSIELNQQNKIPIKKWGVTHYPYADPYSDTYLPED